MQWTMHVIIWFWVTVGGVISNLVTDCMDWQTLSHVLQRGSLMRCCPMSSSQTDAPTRKRGTRECTEMYASV